jgi:hypothetical protein
VLDALARTVPPRALDPATAAALAATPDDRDDVERARLSLIGRLARARRLAITSDARPATAAAGHRRGAARRRRRRDRRRCATPSTPTIPRGPRRRRQLTARSPDQAATPPGSWRSPGCCCGWCGAATACRRDRRRAVAALAARATAGPDDAEARWLRADVGELVRSLAAAGARRR